jgi:hypothetical protein
MTKLELHPYRERSDLLAPSVSVALDGAHANHSSLSNIYVAQIDPAQKGGDDFYATYGVDQKNGASCVVLEASRGSKVWYVVHSSRLMVKHLLVVSRVLNK